ncbi:lysine transporter LysE [Methanothermobacter sp. KEPCO-1]|uniref:LysE family transporter n=1 Tax=Methanothermobacter sp. KEPCO-1 TaxID=2603820 RepID=UPI0011C965E9|nr:LysE family transporter [Methanothermobacter sp. KEPCO-1]QEF94417.1 lysine transporter LysE [Methanothermobacter sp. KEPCO-1]
MLSVILFTVTSFIIGLSGAMAPGPLLTVTVSDSIQGGFRAGPLLVTGHILSETILVVLIFMGMGYLLSSESASSFIGIAGGSVLIWTGIRGLRSGGESSGDIPAGGSVLRGAVISFSNPYFFIWWGAVGAALMYSGVELAGAAGLAGFLVGHWSSDLAWYSLVSFLSSRGAFDTSGKVYRAVMAVCNGFLIMVGAYFFVNALTGI